MKLEIGKIYTCYSTSFGIKYIFDFNGYDTKEYYQTTKLIISDVPSVVLNDTINTRNRDVKPANEEEIELYKMAMEKYYKDKIKITISIPIEEYNSLSLLSKRRLKLNKI